MYKRWPVLCLVLYLSISSTSEAQKTPLCTKCKCSKTDTPDVDCSDVPMEGEMYDPQYYSVNQTIYDINSLNLQNNVLREIGKVFPTSALKKLDLSNNYIKNIVDDAFANLTELVELDLSHNNLQVLRATMFKGLKHIDGFDYPLFKLRVLRLDWNKLHSIDNDAFQHIDYQVEVLSLSHNDIKIIDAQTTIAITGFVNLKELNLSYTGIADIPAGFFHTPKHLRVLDLSGNDFDVIPPEIGAADSLEILYFNDNQILKLDGQNAFPKILNLKILHLCNNKKLEILGEGSLSNLGNLTELYIMNNALTEIDGKALSRPTTSDPIWPSIEKLSLSNNKLGILDQHFLGNWKKLGFIDLQGNPWVCSCDNQWMIEELIPIYDRLDDAEVAKVRCASPVEMEGKLLLNLTSEHSQMRCLDMYGNRPEKDGSVLIGILIGMLIGIPLLLFIMYAYQRHWFGIFDKSPAAYSRQFYKTTPTEDGF